MTARILCPSPSVKVSPRAGSLRLFGLQFKLIMPFLILTLGLSLIGLFIITTLAVDSERERFQNNILDASRVGNDYIVNQEKSQLDRMRFLVFADGMAQAMYDKESDKILSLMQPILTGSNVDIIAAIDNTGREIVTFGLRLQLAALPSPGRGRFFGRRKRPKGPSGYC